MVCCAATVPFGKWIMRSWLHSHALFKCNISPERSTMDGVFFMAGAESGESKKSVEGMWKFSPLVFSAFSGQSQSCAAVCSFLLSARSFAKMNISFMWPYRLLFSLLKFRAGTCLLPGTWLPCWQTKQTSQPNYAIYWALHLSFSKLSSKIS